MLNTRSYAKVCALRGAQICAATFGLGGFVAASILVFAYQLPLPPLLMVEGSLIVGGVLGALIGWAYSTQIGRFTLFGLFLGGFVGVCLPLMMEGRIAPFELIERDCMLGGIAGLLSVLLVDD